MIFGRRVFLCMALSLLIASLSQAEGPSFDCEKAGTKIEKMICADAELAKLDVRLGKAYAAALQQTDDPETLKRQQRQWLKARNACGDAACLSASYTARLEQLAAEQADANSHTGKKEHFPKKNIAKSVELHFSRNDEVCSHLLRILNSDISQYGKLKYAMHREFQADHWLRLGQPEGDDPISQEIYRCYFEEFMKIDINNDGTTECILRRTGCLSGIPSHELFIYKLKDDNLDWFEESPIVSFGNTGGFMVFKEPLKTKNKRIGVRLGGMFTIALFNHKGRNYLLFSDKSVRNEVGKWIVLTELKSDFENEVQCIFENNMVE